MRYNLEKCPVFLEDGDAFETSPFGMRTVNGKKQMHFGVDIVRWAGYNTTAAITAIAPGVVIAVKDTVRGTDHSANLEGNYVALDHGGGLVSKYFHLKYGSIPDAVRVGSRVETGGMLGFMGNTGDSFGAHLHFQLEQDGVPIDGAPYLRGEKRIADTPECGVGRDLDILVKKGVINSPDYWRAQADKVRYLPELLHNMAEVLQK